MCGSSQYTHACKLRRAREDLPAPLKVCVHHRATQATDPSLQTSSCLAGIYIRATNTPQSRVRPICPRPRRQSISGLAVFWPLLSSPRAHAASVRPGLWPHEVQVRGLVAAHACMRAYMRPAQEPLTKHGVTAVSAPLTARGGPRGRLRRKNLHSMPHLPVPSRPATRRRLGRTHADAAHHHLGRSTYAVTPDALRSLSVVRLLRQTHQSASKGSAEQAVKGHSTAAAKARTRLLDPHLLHHLLQRHRWAPRPPSLNPRSPHDA